MKICLNCGDKLLDNAKKCPTCGKKADGFPIVDPKDKELIEKLISEAPNKDKKDAPVWEKKVDTKLGMFQKEKDKKDKKTAEKDRIKQMKEEKIPFCPKCHSTSLTAQKKGFGIGKAVIGRALVGNIGLMAGNIGANKVIVTCLNCGHQFEP